MLPRDTGLRKLTDMCWPIAMRLSGTTARAVAAEQTLSIRLAMTPPCMIAIGWRCWSDILIRALAPSGS